MTLWNFNIFVNLRTMNRVTQDFVTETFGRTYIVNFGVSLRLYAADNSSQRRSDPCRHTWEAAQLRILCLGRRRRIVKGRIQILTCTEASDIARSYSVKSKNKEA